MIIIFSNELDLIKVKSVTDDIGDIVSIETKRTVFCNEKSISQSEFYQAQAVGLKPQIKLIIKALDYENERIVNYEGKRYTVLRTYKATSEDIELVVEGDVNGNA